MKSKILKYMYNTVLIVFLLDVIIGGVYNVFFTSHINECKQELERCLTLTFPKEQFEITNIGDGSGRKIIAKSIIATVTIKDKKLTIKDVKKGLEEKGWRINKLRDPNYMANDKYIIEFLQRKDNSYEVKVAFNNIIEILSL